jgi:ribose transport system substrate-binding protein
MRKSVPVVLTLLTALLSLSCRQENKRVIGMVPKGATQMFWQSVHAGALKAAGEHNMNLLWNAPGQESDRSRQISIVDAMINRHVDAIALAPVDRSALVNVVDRAISQGIPVAVFDSALESDRIVSFIATDNREGGRAAARRMGAALQGKGKVAVIDDMPGSASTGERVRGFEQECRAKFPALEILPVQFVMADRAKARQVAENLLTAHTDLAGIFADHENAAIGAALALSSRQNRGVRLIGFDSSEQLVQYLREGWIDSLVVQNPFRMGYETTRALALKISGGSPAARIDTGSTLVLAGDLDKPEVKALISPDLRQWLEPGGTATQTR